MNAGRNEHTDDAATLDAYVDGQLSGSERAAFEARLGNDSLLAGDLNLHRRLEQSLLGLFAVPPFPGLPVNGQPPESPAQPLNGPFVPLRIAMIGGLIAVVLTAAVWVTYTALANRRLSFEDVYREQVRAGAAPEQLTLAALESECHSPLGRPLRLKNVPPGVEFVGVSEAAVLSPRTMVLRAMVDGQSVIVFADSASNDTPSAQANANECGAALHLFRRELDGLVLYELTPFEAPRLLDQYE